MAITIPPVTAPTSAGSDGGLGSSLTRIYAAARIAVAASARGIHEARRRVIGTTPTPLTPAGGGAPRSAWFIIRGPCGPSARLTPLMPGPHGRRTAPRRGAQSPSAYGSATSTSAATCGGSGEAGIPSANTPSLEGAQRPPSSTSGGRGDGAGASLRRPATQARTGSKGATLGRSRATAAGGAPVPVRGRAIVAFFEGTPFAPGAINTVVPGRRKATAGPIMGSGAKGQTYRAGPAPTSRPGGGPSAAKRAIVAGTPAGPSPAAPTAAAIITTRAESRRTCICRTRASGP